MSIGGGFGNFRGFLLFFLRDRRICDSAPISSFQRRLEAFYNSEAGHPVTWVFLCALRLDCSPARRAFRPPAGGRVTFLCLSTHTQERVRTAKLARRAQGMDARSQERVTKRKDTPESAPYGCANGLRGFSTARPVLAKNWLASVPATLRAFLHPFAALYGAPV
jgi:hypothetical protein